MIAIEVQLEQIMDKNKPRQFFEHQFCCVPQSIIMDQLCFSIVFYNECRQLIMFFLNLLLGEPRVNVKVKLSSEKMLIAESSKLKTKKVFPQSIESKNYWQMVIVTQ